HLVDRFDLVGDAGDGGRVQAEALVAHQRLARDLEHDPAIAGGGGRGLGRGLRGAVHRLASGSLRSPALLSHLPAQYNRGRDGWRKAAGWWKTGRSRRWWRGWTRPGRC